jgi:hypothetical protein
MEAHQALLLVLVAVVALLMQVRLELVAHQATVEMEQQVHYLAHQ